MRCILSFILPIAFIFSISSCTNSETSKTQSDSAFSCLLPVAKTVSSSGKSFSFEGEWAITAAGGIDQSVAYSTLQESVLSISKNNVKLNQHASNKIELILKPGSVQIGQSVDSNHTSLAQQAYHIKLAPGAVSIMANTAQGLYYGVLSFLQLVESSKNKTLPEGEITDWPDLSVRMIYWDDAHHLEKFEAFKKIIRQASIYKINAFALKLEGHFQFASAPAMVEPYAISPQQYQELCDYARKYFVELVPYLDAPAHVSFILKHPEYAKLRLFPNNNYEFSVVNPASIALIKSMFNDLVQASKGCKYIVLSTDEAYYTGKDPGEKEAAIKAGSNGKLLAQFIKTVADDLHAQGRTVLFWGEFPLKPDDIPSLPSYLVNGEYNEMSPEFRRHGIRQFVYTSTQGVEPIFPNYYTLQNDTTTKDSDHSSNRVAGMLKDIRTAVAEKKADLQGVVIAGWADAGLNPETFWLGYATGASAGWNVAASNAEDLSAGFFKLFYHREAATMKRIYQLLSTQAEFYDLSWDGRPSNLRSPILGNSEGLFATPQKTQDQTIPMLPVPSPQDLSLPFNWDSLNEKRMARVEKFKKENDELISLINSNRSDDQQVHHWAVLNSVAMMCRQNLDMLLSLETASHFLNIGAASAKKNNTVAALAATDSALAIVQGIKKERDSVFSSIQSVWYEEWLPLVKDANGRTFFFEVDDIKDHQPGRTIDLSYLIYRELNYRLDVWEKKVLYNRNAYSRLHR